MTNSEKHQKIDWKKKPFLMLKQNQKTLLILQPLWTLAAQLQFCWNLRSVHVIFNIMCPCSVAVIDSHTGSENLPANLQEHLTSSSIESVINFSQSFISCYFVHNKIQTNSSTVSEVKWKDCSPQQYAVFLKIIPLTSKSPWSSAHTEIGYSKYKFL